ncbi:MAG: flotillin family protein [Gemmatimonadaceae bacterium]
MGEFLGTLIAAGVVLGAIGLLLLTIKSLMVIVPPNSAAIITGRNRMLTDGRGVGYRAVIGGRTIRVPILEQVAWMPLSTIPIELNVANAFSKGGIPLSVQAVANVKVASEPETTFNNGVERLLGKSVDEIEELAKETLSANLRGVVATLTPEEVNEDRLKFAAELLQEADQDLQKLGLQLDTLKIQNVTDEVGYLAAVGRGKTAQVIRSAEVAEAQNQAETKQRQAEAMRIAETYQAEADIAVAVARNTLRVKQAELNREAETAERVADVEAQRAEVEAQQKLESQRVELQKRRLLADVVEPAEANRKAAELQARADAAPILENGKAQVEVLKLLYSQINSAGEQGFAVFMAEKLPLLLGTAVDAVKGIEIDRLVVMDGGAGDGVANAANQRINAAYRTMEGLGSALGIDIQQVLQAAAARAGTKAVQPPDRETPG